MTHNLTSVLIITSRPVIQTTVGPYRFYFPKMQSELSGLKFDWAILSWSKKCWWNRKSKKYPEQDKMPVLVQGNETRVSDSSSVKCMIRLKKNTCVLYIFVNLGLADQMLK